MRTDVGIRIKNRRQELRLSQYELAQLCGYDSRSTISKVEKGLRGVPIDKLGDFAKALDTTTAYLMGWEKPEDRIINESAPMTTRSIPVLGQISCGQPIYVNEEIGVSISLFRDVKADFCLVAKGDSMINARINDGDYVFIKKQATVNNGDIAVIIINEEATLKRVYYDANNHKLVLQAENPSYPPMVFVNDELREISILGKAVAFCSKII